MGTKSTYFHDIMSFAMALNKVEICGVNTSRLPILTNEEKDALFVRIKEGDPEAREQYIKGNLRLVLSVIKRFSSSNENADDLFQIGCVGLIKAIDNFDTTLNVKFSTYAVPMIIGEIRRYLRDNNAIRVSRSLRDVAYKAIYAKENYVKQNLKEPTSMKSPKKSALIKRKSYMLWMPFKVLSACMNLSIQREGIPFMSWTKSAIKKIKKIIGLKTLL